MNPLIIALMLLILASHAYAGDVRYLLPAVSCAEGWRIDGERRVFKEDNLYDHINGEAEMYVPYNFKIMATAAYNRDGQSSDSIIVDVYQMGSVLDAFGIYSNYRRHGSLGFSIGTEGYADDSLLMFYKGAFFVRLTALGKVGRAEIERCAGLVESNIKGKFAPPVELKRLRIDNVRRGSEKYVAQSLLGYPFFRKGLIAETEIRGKRFSVFVITESFSSEAKKTINAYIQHLFKEGFELKEIRRGKQAFLIGNEPLYKRVILYQSDRHIVGVIRFEDDEGALEIIRKIIRVLD